MENIFVELKKIDFHFECYKIFRNKYKSTTQGTFFAGNFIPEASFEWAIIDILGNHYNIPITPNRVNYFYSGSN